VELALADGSFDEVDFFLPYFRSCSPSGMSAVGASVRSAEAYCSL